MLNPTQNILNRLAVADRVHQKEAGCKLLLRAVKYFCEAILLVFLLDVIFHLVAPWRAGLSLAIIAAILALAILAWHRAFIQRNSLEYIARFLESRDRSLGSRLINLLQLNCQTENDAIAPPTRDLARRAVDTYVSGLASVPMERIARTGEPVHLLKRAAWALLTFVAIVAIAFPVTLVEIVRFADPFGDHPPYSFTHLEILQPDARGTSVLYGNQLIVKVKAGGHQPGQVFLTSFPPGHPEQAVTVPMFDESGASYSQLIVNIQTDLIVYAHTKDHSTESGRVHVSVTLTPQLETTFVHTTPPAYTGIKPEEKVYDFKGVQVLEGSEVQFRLQSNRPLREGFVEIAGGDQTTQRISLKKSAANEVTGSFIAKDSGRLNLGIIDIAGLSAQGDFESSLTVTHDLPPEVHIVNPEHDSFVAMDFKLQARIEASDDYGLREIRFHRGLNGVYSAPKIYKYKGIVLDRAETSGFNFTDLGIKPGDVISFFAEAVDNAPQPHISHSQTIHLQVISVEDYNNYLREQTDISDTEAKYADLNADLQNLIQSQKDLGDAEQKAKDQLAKADPSQRDALLTQFDSLIARQSELDQKLDMQASRMENFVRNHPLYDVEDDLQKLLSQQAANMRQSIHANDAVTRQIAQQSSPVSGSRQMTPGMLQTLKQASDDQVAKLDQAHSDAVKQVVQPLEDMSQMQELMKDFNVFEDLYHDQQDLSQQAQGYNRPGQMSREDQLAMADLAGSQKRVGDILDQLQQKLLSDADDAEKKFPKAAASGRALANEIDGARMEGLADQATGRMLAADGEQSFALADRLRAEMEKLFADCQEGNCPGSNELDNYLHLLRMNPGNNFAQMARSRKFGIGRGQSGGSGMGMAGTAGYAVMDGSSLEVLGNETSTRNSGRESQSNRNGKGGSPMEAYDKERAGTPDVIKGLNPVNRQSAANSSETDIEEYSMVVDSYFKAITSKKEKANP